MSAVAFNVAESGWYRVSEFDYDKRSRPCYGMRAFFVTPPRLIQIQNYYFASAMTNNTQSQSAQEAQWQTT